MASDAFLGEIRLFAFSTVPEDWLVCDGSLLSTNAYGALFSLIGTQYGGNGVSNFALPDLRGRFPIGIGQGQGLSPVVAGERGGVEEITLAQANLPSHTHAAAFANGASLAQPCFAGNGGLTNPSNAVPSAVTESSIGVMNAFASASAANAKLAPIPLDGAQIGVGFTGGGQPVNIRGPFLGLVFCICINGVYPT